MFTASASVSKVACSLEITMRYSSSNSRINSTAESESRPIEASVDSGVISLDLAPNSVTRS